MDRERLEASSSEDPVVRCLGELRGVEQEGLGVVEPVG